MKRQCWTGVVQVSLKISMRTVFILLIALFLFHNCCYGSDPFSLAALNASPLQTDFAKNAGPEPESSEFLQRTSFSRAPQNFAKNLVSLFSRRNLIPLVIGASATGVSTVFDDNIHKYFEQRDTGSAFADIGSTIGEPYVLIPAVGGLLLMGQHSRSSRFRGFTYALFQGYALDGVMSISMKQATRRERPDLSNNQSFPSGHSADFFMIATLLQQYYGRKAGMIGYGLAGYVAASRLKKDVHWLSDVVAGATLGYIIGRTVSRNTGSLLNSGRVSFVPIIATGNKEYGLSIHIRFP